MINYLFFKCSWELRISECSQTCGDGSRTLTYKCVQSSRQLSYKQTVDDSYCSHAPRPPNSWEKCYGKCEQARWKYGQWEAVSTVDYFKIKPKISSFMHHKIVTKYKYLNFFLIIINSFIINL